MIDAKTKPPGPREAQGNQLTPIEEMFLHMPHQEALRFLAWAMTKLGLKVLRRADINYN